MFSETAICKWAGPAKLARVVRVSTLQGFWRRVVTPHHPHKKNIDLEPELDACLKTEIALAVVAASEVVAEARQFKIGIHQSNGNSGGHGNVDAATDRHRKRIVCGIN
jgi:hypothetical protein